jgi:peptide/nickel transport system substrate-binding protein
MEKKIRTLLTVSVLAILLVVHSGSTQVGAAEVKGVMRVAIHFGISADWLHPSLPPSDSTRFLPLYFFHDALVKPMPNGALSPCLAESWKTSSNYKVFEFKLRKGVKFHNGDEMTAEDVVFSFRRYAGDRADLFKSKIDKLEAVNPYLFRITFKTPFINFLSYALPGASTIFWIVPKKYIEKVGDAEFKQHPIGCGPYRFVEFKPGQGLVGEAFEGFWRKKPGVKRLEFIFVDQASTRFAMLVNGEADLATAMTGDFYERMKKERNVTVGGALSPNRWCLFPTSQWDPKSPWSDARVRKAASLAIDRQGIIDVHFPGARAIGSIALPGDPEGLEVPPDPYDPKKARQLMIEAGYPNGFDGGKFFPAPGGPGLAMAEQFMNYLRAIGITSEMAMMDRPTYVSLRRTGKMAGGIIMEPASAGFMDSRLEDFFMNSGHYGDYPEIKLLWEQYNASSNAKARKSLMQRLQGVIYEKNMIIPVCENKSPAGFGPRLKGSPYGIQGGYPVFYPTPMEDLQLKE